MADELVTIARFKSATGAHEARIELEAAGIESLIADDSAANAAFPGLFQFASIRLQVKQTDVPQAVRILRDTPAASFLVVAVEEEPEANEEGRS